MSYIEDEESRINPGDIIHADVYRLQARVQMRITGASFMDEKGELCVRLALMGQNEGIAVPIMVVDGGYYRMGDTLIKFLPNVAADSLANVKRPAWRGFLDNIKRRIRR